MLVASWLAAALPFLAAAETFLQAATDRRAASARSPEMSLPRSPSVAFSQLPIEVAQQAHELALNLAWYQADAHFGSSDRAQDYQNAAAANWASMKSLAQGLLDGPGDLDNFVDGFRWLALAVSTYVADFLKSGATGMDRVQDHLRQLQSIQELGADLVQNMYQMCFGAAWFAANNCTGHEAESLSNFTLFKEYRALIGTQTLLHNVDFDSMHGRVTREIQTRVVATQELHNDADSEQEFHVAVQYAQGFTTAFLNIPGVRILIDEMFREGFRYDFVAAGTFSTDLLFNDTVGTHITGVARNFTVPVTVPANATYFVTAMVQEVTLEVPITMNVSCSNKHWVYAGVWTGAATSHFTYEVHRDPPDSDAAAQIIDGAPEPQFLVIY